MKMNGYYQLENNYLNQYLDILNKSEPYQDDLGICIDIAYKDADFTLVFLASMELPEKKDISALIEILIELDSFIAKRENAKKHYIEEGCEYQFSYVEVKSLNEITMYYGGVNVNAQWGAEFIKKNGEKWDFLGLC